MDPNPALAETSSETIDGMTQGQLNPQIKVDDGRRMNKSGLLEKTQPTQPIQSNEYRLNTSYTNKQDSDINNDSPKSNNTKLLEKEGRSQVGDQNNQ